MHVLIVTPFGSGLEYIVAAKARGIRVSAVTVGHPEFAIPDAYAKQIDRIEQAKEKDVEDFVRCAQNIHADNPIDGVVAGEECYVPMVAHIAKSLGLPGLDPDRAEVVRNKARMRECLQAAGIRIPRFAKATNAIDIEQVAKTVGFPLVVKPVNMAASIGVVRADDTVEVLAAYEDILHEERGLSGFLPASEVLVEELLVGTEYCVDGYVTQDGVITICELVRVELGPQPHFQEVGYTSYRPEDLEVTQELSDYITAVVRAVGITVGAFHSEVMLTDDGPVLIEIAHRLPGDHLPLLTEIATGVNFADCGLAATLGLPIADPKPPKARVAASQYIIASELAGESYRELKGWDEIKGQPEVDAATIEVAAGSIIPTEEDARARIAEIRYHADSVAAAEAFRQKIIATVHVEK